MIGSSILRVCASIASIIGETELCVRRTDGRPRHHQSPELCVRFGFAWSDRSRRYKVYATDGTYLMACQQVFLDAGITKDVRTESECVDHDHVTGLELSKANGALFWNSQRRFT